VGFVSCRIEEFLPALRQIFGEDMKIIKFFCELLMIVAGALEVGPAWRAAHDSVQLQRFALLGFD
jgi:hypothetical protein